jgi:hypothetical protein
MSKPNIVEAMSDRRLFEPWFRGRSWDGWKAMLKAAHGIPMQPEEIKLLHKLAERDPPKRQVREFWVCGGRRLGKDSIASLSVGHSAAFFDGGKKLRRGERARFLSLACSRDQSRIALEYTRSYYTEIKPLAGMVSRLDANAKAQCDEAFGRGRRVVIETNADALGRSDERDDWAALIGFPLRRE